MPTIMACFDMLAKRSLKVNLRLALCGKHNTTVDGDLFYRGAVFDMENECVLPVRWEEIGPKKFLRNAAIYFCDDNARNVYDCDKQELVIFYDCPYRNGLEEYFNEKLSLSDEEFLKKSSTSPNHER